MRPLVSRSLALCAVLCLGGCATTSQTTPVPEAPPPQAEQAQAPAEPPAPAPVPAVPLKRPEPLQLKLQGAAIVLGGDALGVAFEPVGAVQELHAVTPRRSWAFASRAPRPPLRLASAGMFTACPPAHAGVPTRAQRLS